MRLLARRLTSVFTVAIVSAIATRAHAQAQAQGYAIDRFNPSERGSDWFAEDSLDIQGKFRGAIGIVGDFSERDLVIYNANGSERSIPVKYQVILHPGASVILADRLRLAFDLPVAPYEDGDAGAVGTTQFPRTDGSGLGDLRVSADARLFGRYGEAFTLAFGVSAFFPTGAQSAYLSDGDFRIMPRLAMAGDVGPLTYAAHVGFQYRPLDNAFPGYPTGSEINVGASLGLRAFDKKLLIGPEVYASSVVTSSSAFLSTRQTPVEGMFGIHYVIAHDFRIGGGAATGFTRAFGEPALRGVADLEWAPAYVRPVTDRDHDGIPDKVDACPDVFGVATDDPRTNGCPPPPSDRDHDGIIDLEDACPDVPGIRTDDPKTNGCPDRDHDGIPDPIDACPDVPGIHTDDPKTNGCPSDRDHDGIIDLEDACPDVPGIRTNDPKTNGCPPDPDRDHDGIPNAEDACPDIPGPRNADPKKNGCPQAFIENDQIRIMDEVKFATASAAIVTGKDSKGVLDAVLKVIEEHPEIARIRIEGHTDNVGTAAYNKDLSKRRAASVVGWLVHHGIARDRLTSEGFGFDRPIESNDTAEGRHANRRVEFHIVKQ